ncbi:MAG: Eco57I restriction-modification methylase domain-containing protein [Candidatus Heimdallarchaeota archaeon]|nr:Eco57I restriction-modification methylase domain-containing protein [Candidatus Heimdallarchaeota archaeon]MCK4290390.1 Eco57I restriction-modification methylase domain-containing protein [Candidatus Heimdallarchaeota archaeon]
MTKKHSNNFAFEFYKEYSNIRELLIDSFNDKISYYQKIVYSQQIIFNLFVIGFLIDNGIIKKVKNKKLNHDEFFTEQLKDDSFFSVFLEISNFCRTYSTDRIFSISSQKFYIPFFNLDFFILLSELDENSVSLSSSSREQILNYVMNVSKNPRFSFDLFGSIFEQDLALLEVLRKNEISAEQEIKILTKLTERRKKGIFYTPKTVTDFICRKTVYSYLLEHFNIVDRKLESAITKMNESELNELYDLICEIKILDPACGAGNFLLETCDLLFNLRIMVLQKLSRNYNPTIIKKEILISNIFGVDIQEIATSITTLRLWLWLLEDYKNKSKKNLLPDLVPNIQTGNTLIGYSSEKITPIDYDYTINPEILDLIIEAQKELLQIHREDENNDILDAFTDIVETLKASSVEQRIFTNQDLLEATFGNLQIQLREKNVDFEVKLKLKPLYNQIRKLLYDIFNEKFLNFLQNKIKKSSINLKDLELLKPFHWRVDFADIINDGGFDIIVGNPPYLENKKLRNLVEKKILKEQYKTAYKLYDLSILFIERSHMLLKEKGYFSFIITNKFISTDYGIKIRKLILKETKLKEIIDVSYLPIFKDAATYPIILTFSKASTTLDVKNLENEFLIIPKLDKINLLKTERFKKVKAKQSNYYSLPKHVFDLTGNFSIINEIINSPKSVKLSELGRFSYRILGFTDWEKSLELISTKRTSKDDLKFIGTTNVFQYSIDWKKTIKLSGKRLESTYLPYTKKHKAAWETFKKQKILIKEISKKLTASFDPGIFANATGIYMFLSKNECNLKLLVLLLNSKLLDYIFSTLFGSTHMAGGYLRFNGSYLKELPIIIPKDEWQQNLLANLCDYLSFLQQLVIGNNIRIKLLEFLSKIVNYLVLEVYFESEFTKSIFSEIKNLVKPIDFDKWFKLYFNNDKKGDLEHLTQEILQVITSINELIIETTDVEEIINNLQKNKKLALILSD